MSDRTPEFPPGLEPPKGWTTGHEARKGKAARPPAMSAHQVVLQENSSLKRRLAATKEQWKADMRHMHAETRQLQGKVAALEQECEAHRAAREDMARLATEARQEAAAQVAAAREETARHRAALQAALTFTAPRGAQGKAASRSGEAQQLLAAVSTISLVLFGTIKMGIRSAYTVVGAAMGVAQGVPAILGLLP